MRKLLYIFGLLLTFATVNQLWLNGRVAQENLESDETVQYVSKAEDDGSAELPFSGSISLAYNLSHQLLEIQLKTRTQSSIPSFRHRSSNSNYKILAKNQQTLLVTLLQAIERTETAPFAFSSPCLYYVFALRRILC